MTRLEDRERNKKIRERFKLEFLVAAERIQLKHTDIFVGCQMKHNKVLDENTKNEWVKTISLG